MKELVLIVLLCVMVLLVMAPLASAFEMPGVCAYAGYGPQWLTRCIIEIAFELWLDPLELLSQLR